MENDLLQCSTILTSNQSKKKNFRRLNGKHAPGTGIVVVNPSLEQAIDGIYHIECVCVLSGL